jgi:hypothetical protein
MKLIALAAAGLLAAAALTPVPADAQPRSGWSRHDNRGHNGWDRGRGWERGHHYGNRDRWRHRGRSYVKCRWVRTYYGRERRCFRMWR